MDSMSFAPVTDKMVITPSDSSTPIRKIRIDLGSGYICTITRDRTGTNPQTVEATSPWFSVKVTASSREITIEHPTSTSVTPRRAGEMLVVSVKSHAEDTAQAIMVDPMTEALRAFGIDPATLRNVGIATDVQPLRHAGPRMPRIGGELYKK